MPDAWFDQQHMKKRLVAFFQDRKESVTTFGSTVNQTFEAFVFAALVAWYRKEGWQVRFVHPGKRVPGARERLVLKFSTRGRPANYSYAICTRGEEAVQIHHQLRVATYHHKGTAKHAANICLDVAVLRETDVTGLRTDDAIPNGSMLTFGEAKHMSAFAELVAGFIGMAHEMKPSCVKTNRKGKLTPVRAGHLPPFLYVSGTLYRTAKGIVESMEDRRLSIKVFSSTNDLTDTFRLEASHFGVPKKKQPPTKRTVGARKTILGRRLENLPF